MRYGQITTVYSYGGADIWDLLQETAYPLSLDAEAAQELAIGTLFTFEVDPNSGWAEPRAYLNREDLPEHVRAALETPAPADPEAAVCFMG